MRGPCACACPKSVSKNTKKNWPIYSRSRAHKTLWFFSSADIRNGCKSVVAVYGNKEVVVLYPRYIISSIENQCQKSNIKINFKLSTFGLSWWFNHSWTIPALCVCVYVCVCVSFCVIVRGRVIFCVIVSFCMIMRDCVVLHDCAWLCRFVWLLCVFVYCAFFHGHGQFAYER
jgi:hypothetical protein